MNAGCLSEKHFLNTDLSVAHRAGRKGGFPNPVLYVALLALVHSTTFAKEAWLDDFTVGEISCGYSGAHAGKSISDKPLSIGGVVFTRGVGVHAVSSGVFMNEGNASLQFKARVGVDDSTDGPGSVVFQIFGDDLKLYDSGLLRKGDAAVDVNVDLAAYKQIELRVTDGGDGINFDHADWCDARFIYSDTMPVLAPRWTITVPHYSGEAPVIPSEVSTLKSPDGKIAASVGVSNRRLVIGIQLDGRDVLKPSPLGITIDGVDLGEDVELGAAEIYTTDVTYPDPSGSGTLRDQCRGAKFKVQSKAGRANWILDVRTYDDGVAWRYIVPGRGPRMVGGEATSFVVPDGSIYWSNTNTKNYEANYFPVKATGSVASQPVTMPLTVELPDGGFACITEADNLDYSGMTIGPRGRILAGLFEDDAQGWELTGDITTPWRIVIAASDLNALVNQSIVYNVSPPLNTKLFPEGRNAKWIKPGRAFWTWIVGQWDTAQWDRIFGYVDDAAELNCQYYVIDDPWRDPRMGWHRNGHDEWPSLKEVCDYAAKKNVKIMVWEHWSRISDPAAREEFFRNVSESGAVGVKIDFMDSESHERLAFYKSCLELGARYHVLINFHGANKPAGEERTWPNLMTREGIYGMENLGGIQRRHLAALPFTRCVTGPADFTPTVFQPRLMGSTTAGSQLATSVLYSSKINHWGDSLETYAAQPAQVLDFIRTKPVIWDETVVLPGSRIGEAALMARRSGDIWYVAAVNGTDQVMTREIEPGFLKGGTWSAVAFSDVAGDKTKFDVKKSVLSLDKSITVRMEPGGGFVMVLTPRR
ncbi:MAG: glycoside hydrolase family 97 catalytic domain-containing protein [Pontiellaceae bacterium]|nr:glycoside hydrolase family 97 catalytic domain-containing protein [Pontiellaceae bacterium]MBN2786188.1 glycoside hydrolase family 97 catalytic domain-containing protein [Pontiellaceae bacterium]